MWKGILAAAITPFDADGAIDVKAHEDNLERLVVAGCAALVINAVTGEGLSMTQAERSTCVRLAVKQSAGRVPVIATVGSVSESETIEDARLAAAAGADGLLALVPYFYRMATRERVEYFRRISASVDLPMIIYNTHYANSQLSVEEFEAIADAVPRFVGIKEGHQLQASEAVRRLSPRVAVYAARDSYIHELGFSGGAGAVTYSSNVAPELTVQLWRAIEAGDVRESLRLQRELNPIAWALVKGSFPSSVKAAMNLAGWKGGIVRAPLLAVPQDEAKSLEAVVRKLHPTRGVQLA